MSNEELTTKVTKLEEDVASLLAWKQERERQQITSPLDQESITVLNENFMRMTDDVVLTLIGADAHYVPVLLGKQGDKTFDLTRTYIRYSADASTDVITIVDKTPYTKFADDEALIFYVDFLTGDTAPGGITAGSTTYYARDTATDGYSFKIALAPAGAAINITDGGVGKQFIQKQ